MNALLRVLVFVSVSIVTAGSAMGQSNGPARVFNSVLTAKLFLLGTLQGPGVSGTVRSAEGRGLADVFIFFDRGIADIETTRQDGSFVLPRRGRYIAFFRNGYRPVINVVVGDQPMSVVLEPGDATEWNVPPCKSLKSPGRRIGFLLKFLVPREAKTIEGGDVDFSMFRLGINGPKESFWLEGGVGPTWASAGPREANLLNASKVVVRSYRAGDRSGFDVKGRSESGQYWRYLGWVGQSVNYRVASNDAATALDKIIDGACY